MKIHAKHNINHKHLQIVMSNTQIYIIKVIFKNYIGIIKQNIINETIYLKSPLKWK
jgi:hypothetical protein